jgi:hypothetical protein
MPTQEQFEQSDFGKTEQARIVDHFVKTFGEFIPESVRCDCGWFGMSDNCRYNRCPNCGQRVTKDIEIGHP